MRNLSWIMIVCLSISIMFGCGGNAATAPNTSENSAETSKALSSDIAARLADYEMTKQELLILKQDRALLYDLYLTKGGSSSGSSSADLAKIKEIEEKLFSKNEELSSMKNDLILTKNEADSLKDKLTEANMELENTKTALEEAKKNALVAPKDDVDRVGIEGGVLMNAALAAKSKERGIEITAMINDFVSKNPSEKDNFTETLESLLKLPNVNATYNADAVTNFAEIAALTGNNMIKCPSADDLPGIVRNIIADEVKFAKSADITLLIDTTSTMKDEIDKLKRSIGSMYPELTKLCKDIRISIVTYRDIDTKFGKVGYVTQIEGKFTRVLREIVLAVRKISINTKGGNYDVPEAVYEGLMSTFNELAWSDRAEKRLVVLIGDAPAGTGEKFRIHPKRGKTDLKAAHKFTLEDIKKQLETLKTTMMTDDIPINIIPIVCSEK